LITGEYWPVFGIMGIDADCSESFAENVEMKAAFWHEEMHYVENFLTLYGINRSLEIMRRLIKAIKDAHSGSYSTGLTKDEDFIHTTFQIMAGDNYEIKCHEIESIELKSNIREFYGEQYNAYIQDEIDTVELVFHNDKQRYDFGGEAVCESVSYLFEKYMCESNDYSHTFPYNACEMIYEYYWKKKCDNTKALLFLGLVSLMNLFPGVAFVNYMKKLKENDDFSLNSVRAISLKHLRFGNKELLDKLEEGIDTIIPLSFVDMGERYEIHKEKVIYSNRWLKELYKNSIDNQIDFITIVYILLENNNKISKEILGYMIVWGIGKPVIYDINGKVYDENRNDMRLFLFAPETLYHILVEKKKNCRLYPICKNLNYKCNTLCETDCTKYKHEDSLCILRYYLNLLGLEDLDLDELCY